MFGKGAVQRRLSSPGNFRSRAQPRTLRRGDEVRLLRLESLEQRRLLTVIANPSFETGDFTGWITQDVAAPHEMLRVAQSGDSLGVIPVSPPMFTTLGPTDGNFAATHGFDGKGPGVIRIAQEITVSDPIISFDYRAEVRNEFGASEDRRFDVKIDIPGGGENLLTSNILIIHAGTTLTDTGDLNGSVDLSAFIGQAVRLSFEFLVPEEYTGPGAFQLDNIRASASHEPSPTWQNPRNPADVDDSGSVTALDALLIINALSRAGTNLIDLGMADLPNLPMYPDVSGDGRVTALDALLVINALNRLSLGEQAVGAEGEAGPPAAISAAVDPTPWNDGSCFSDRLRQLWSNREFREYAELQPERNARVAAFGGQAESNTIEIPDGLIGDATTSAAERDADELNIDAAFADEGATTIWW